MKNKIFLDIATVMLRRALPKDVDFCLTAWRMRQDDELEMWTVSQGNPQELEFVLTETLRDLKAANATPLSAVH